MSIEVEIKNIAAQVKETGDKLRQQAEDSAREIKRTGEMSAQTKVEVDKLLTTQNELKERLSAAEQLVAKLEEGGDSRHQAKEKTAGEIVASHEDFLAIRNKASWKGTVTIPVKNVITSLDDSAGALIQPQRAPMVNPVNRRLFVRQLLAQGRTTSNSIEYVRETGFTNNAAPVSENPATNKPESNIVFELDNESVATIAHWIRASRQVLSDVSMMQSYIDGRLRYGLDLVVEDQILNGSGTGLNMHGIIPQASTYANPGVTVSNETMIDRLRLAMLQVALAEYEADGIVLHPVDWTSIELTKDNENRYIFTNPTTAGTPTLWGLPVSATQSIASGDYLVGAFQMGAQFWTREDATVSVSTEDRDNIVKNMVTILAELRAALTVYRPEAFVTGSFDSL